MTTPRQFKDAIYQHLAQVGKAFSSPLRLELISLLAQRPHAVADLATQCGQSIANTSQHLQVLKHAHLVQTERQGSSIIYQLQPGVAEALVVLQDLAEARVRELEQLKADFFADRDGLQPIDTQTLRDRLQDGSVTLIDVRPAAEYSHHHLPGARSIPLTELEARLSELPKGREVVAYCRGPYCVFSADAVRLLRERGFAARRLESGADTLLTGER